MLFNFGLYSANIGQHEEAIAAMRQLVRLSEQVGLPADSDYGIWHRSGLARTLLAAGQVDEAGALLGGLHTGTLQPGRPYLAWARTAAEYHLALGDPATALAVLQPAVAWWRQSASLHDADVLLQLALAAHAAGLDTVAQRSVAEATTLLETTDIHRYQLRLYAARHRILGDPRDLASARTALAVQAAAFSDPALRHAFEQNVALHREIAG